MKKNDRIDDTLWCLIDQREYDLIDGNFLHELDPFIKESIHKDFPKASDNSFICSEHLVHYRLNKMNRMINDDHQKNKQINDRMTKLMSSDDYKIIDVEKQLETTLTFGQKVADGVARFGGSWTFVISFISIIVIWIFINATHLFGLHFDPFPFILLNLFLSIIAAIQAPLIMMSQNRSGNYDRMESKNDYHVNLKSEEEIRLLHSKIDHLIQQDQPNNLQIQKMQMEMMASINNQIADLKKEQAKLKH
ncbi:DUF1003 domain-containing protein [Fructobacillus ficulneus]|uniref:Cyclic nucleotide-binding protein n=1 Tax=Fructobacillus ficulneus TaxID=157463 RepID=A0A0K8MIF0_9LACO|nr:DUF1003 domain-containing protein [Fructobacillus ficulneus]GAP00336.1 hypothetical protein FFIC_283530 [Fructobacillus ficulneus]